MVLICQLAAVKQNSCPSELKLHLTIGPHGCAKHCSIPSCMFQMGKEHTSYHPGEICSDNDMKWNHGDLKWLSCQILFSFIITFFFFLSRNTHCLWRICPVSFVTGKSGKAVPPNLFMWLTGTIRDTALPAKWQQVFQSWLGGWTKRCIHIFAKEEDMRIFWQS